MNSLYGTGSRKAPASTALALVLDGGNGSMLCPVPAGRKGQGFDTGGGRGKKGEGKEGRRGEEKEGRKKSGGGKEWRK